MYITSVQLKKNHGTSISHGHLDVDIFFISKPTDLVRIFGMMDKDLQNIRRRVEQGTDLPVHDINSSCGSTTKPSPREIAMVGYGQTSNFKM